MKKDKTTKSITAKEVTFLQECKRNFYRIYYFSEPYYSLNRESANSFETHIGDSIATEDTSDRNLIYEISFEKDINRALDVLTPREKEVIVLHLGLNPLKYFDSPSIKSMECFQYYGDKGMSFEDIRPLYNLSRERIRQIFEKGIERLKMPHRIDILKKYLGQ